MWMLQTQTAKSSTSLVIIYKIKLTNKIIVIAACSIKSDRPHKTTKSPHLNQLKVLL